MINVTGGQVNYKDKIKVFTDGGSRGNPGEAAIGVVIKKDNKAAKEFGKKIGIATNNIAEYTAVLEALVFAKKNIDFGEADFFLDSELVVRQLNGIYKVKDKNLKKIFLKIRQLISESGAGVTFSHITREKNERADKLVNNALDGG